MDLGQLASLGPFLAPFLGTIVGAAIALGGTYITQRNVWRVEVAKDARALRDAKRERLRSSYELILSRVVDFPGYLHRGANADFDRAVDRLRLEPDATQVLTVLWRSPDHPDLVRAMQKSLAQLEQPIRNL